MPPPQPQSQILQLVENFQRAATNEARGTPNNGKKGWCVLKKHYNFAELDSYNYNGGCGIVGAGAIAPESIAVQHRIIKVRLN
jgi:hypothetical protein